MIVQSLSINVLITISNPGVVVQWGILDILIIFAHGGSICGDPIIEKIFDIFNHGKNCQAQQGATLVFSKNGSKDNFWIQKL
jgi:hypothetical protein